MDLTNESYLIRISTKTWSERYRKDKRGWAKTSSRGNTFRMTAEQVLNHLLPALAGVKPGITVEVEHRPARATAPLRKAPAKRTAKQKR
jgi:hypothetical protein